MNSKETQEKIQELNIIGQNLQSLLLQKQAFQVELNETSSAIEEIKKVKEDEIYKITGQIMIKANKEDILKELEEKKKLLELRISSIEKQEKLLEKKSEEIREEIQKSGKK